MAPIRHLNLRREIAPRLRCDRRGNQARREWHHGVRLKTIDKRARGGVAEGSIDRSGNARSVSLILGSSRTIAQHG